MPKPKKQPKPQSGSEPQPEEQGTETATATADPEPETETTGEANHTTGRPAAAADLPNIGDTVLYFERDEVVAAHSAGREIRPHAAIVTGIETLDGEEGLLQLAEFHPSEGVIVRRHVRRAGLANDAHTWIPKPADVPLVRVPMTQLAEACKIAIEMMTGDKLDAAADPVLKNQAGDVITGDTEVPGPAPIDQEKPIAEA